MKVSFVDRDTVAKGRVLLEASADEVAKLCGFRTIWDAERPGRRAPQAGRFKLEPGLVIPVDRLYQAVEIVLERREYLERLRRQAAEQVEIFDQALACLHPDARPEIES